MPSDVTGIHDLGESDSAHSHGGLTRHGLPVVVVRNPAPARSVNASNLTPEDPAVPERYSQNRWVRHSLVARRRVEARVPCVTIATPPTVQTLGA